MRTRVAAIALAIGALACLPVRAQSELSALSAISALPVASVVAGLGGPHARTAASLAARVAGRPPVASLRLP